MVAGCPQSVVYEAKIKEGAKPFLEQDEEVLAAFVARPRGWTRRVVATPNLAAGQHRRAYAAAEQAEFPLASPMALALTQTLPKHSTALD